jgi:hypothetical protein
MGWGGVCSKCGRYEKYIAYRIFVRRPEGMRPLVRPRRRWEDNFKMNIKMNMLMFMSMGRGYICELRPLAGLFFIPQMVYEYGDPRWNNIGRGNSWFVHESCPEILPVVI